MSQESSLTCINKTYCHGGWQYVCEHNSKSTKTKMQFAVFLPSGYHVNLNNDNNQILPYDNIACNAPNTIDKKIGAVLFLSGLTCTWENVMSKGHIQEYCTQNSLAFIATDTSPRGDNVPNDAEYDLGQGAGFYVNATQEKWKKHFQMYDYICEDIYSLIATYFPINMDHLGITGHSMGGHGALVIGMRNPQKFLSISAFSPIVSPMNCPWGIKAFSEYLGKNSDTWKEYDACHIAQKNEYKRPILIDQGKNDAFLDNQLQPWLFENACENTAIDLTLTIHDHYDHSYYFVSSFLKNHLTFHHKAMQKKNTI